MNNMIAVAGVAVIAGMVAIAFLAARKAAVTGAYRSRPLMTENEAEFFGRLVVALPDHYVFPQVALTALLEPASRHRATAHSDRLRIAQQRVDYVVCGRCCTVIAVVELDDRTHVAAKDNVRDARLAGAGIRTVRFQSRSKPPPAAIREAVLGTDPAATSSARSNPPAP